MPLVFELEADFIGPSVGKIGNARRHPRTT
jgi:hypothetical protein